MLMARADVVGSLLRPPELLEARKGFLSGTLSSEKFKAIEDRAVDAAITLQEEAGWRVGYRRGTTAALLPEPDDRGGGRLRRMGPGRVLYGVTGKATSASATSESSAPTRLQWWGNSRGSGGSP